MFCKYCGAQITDGASFCENCGSKIIETKYCGSCGNEIPADARVCPVCGFYQNPEVRSQPVQPEYSQPGYGQPVNPVSDREETLKTIVKIFMIFGCISIGWLIIPLLWCIPLTAGVFNKFKTGEEITVGTKICVLLFVNLIAGICLLCMDD